MHPFFRYGLGNSSSHGSSQRKDSSSRCKSPSGSNEEEEEVAVTSVGKSSPQRSKKPSEIPPPAQNKKGMAVPVIKVDDQVVFTGATKSRRESNENKRRLGPNKNNIILETLQNDQRRGK